MNDPERLARVLDVLDGIRTESAQDGRPVSLADLIVLGGTAAVEQAAADAEYTLSLPFAPGRTDASAEQTDAASFEALEPRADGFRNDLSAEFSVPDEELLLDRARLLALTAPEITALVGVCAFLGRTKAGHPQAC